MRASYRTKITNGLSVIDATHYSQGNWIDFLKPHLDRYRASGNKVNLSDIIENNNRSVHIIMPSDDGEQGKIVLNGSDYGEIKAFAVLLFHTVIYFAIILCAISAGKCLLR